MDAFAAAGCKPREAFGRVFGDILFVSSTYSDNVYIWVNSRDVVLEAASKGRCESGEWADLVRSYGKKSNGKGRA